MIKAWRRARGTEYYSLCCDLRTVLEQCYPGSKFLQNQIASDPGLAQEANWGDVNALVGTMADQIVATIC